jgi:hypothetical protein
MYVREADTARPSWEEADAIEMRAFPAAISDRTISSAASRSRGAIRTRGYAATNRACRPSGLGAFACQPSASAFATSDANHSSFPGKQTSLRVVGLEATYSRIDL